MTPEALEEIRSRIHRAHVAARQPSGTGYEQIYKLEDGTTHSYSVTGVKSPEQLKDDLLNLFSWIWHIKDYLKELYKAKGLNGNLVEAIVNRTTSLQYVSDITNRSKHGILNKSRSNDFAELVDVSISIPQTSIAKISVEAFSVGVEIKQPNGIQLHAYVKTKSGHSEDAFAVLTNAISAWEELAIKPIKT